MALSQLIHLFGNVKSYAVVAAVGSAAFGLAESYLMLKMSRQKTFDEYVARFHTLESSFHKIMVAIQEMILCALTLAAGGLATYLSSGEMQSHFLTATGLNGAVLVYSIAVMYPNWDRIPASLHKHGDAARTRRIWNVWIFANCVRALVPLIAAALYVYGNASTK